MVGEAIWDAPWGILRLRVDIIVVSLRNAGRTNFRPEPSVSSPRFLRGAKALNDWLNSSVPFSSPSDGLALSKLNPFHLDAEMSGPSCSRARPSLLSHYWFSLMPAASAGFPLCELRSGLWRLPVAVTAPHVCLAEYAQSLRGRTRPLRCWVIFLPSDRALLSQQFVCPA